jgi:isopentenyl diphosphate isomerase/L-lactate dehydrogenase-like FMN-dependent dehydrogenase
VLDFEPAARRTLPPAHWGYMASGSDDNLTINAKTDAFQRIRLKPRRLVGVARFARQDARACHTKGGRPHPQPDVRGAGGSLQSARGHVGVGRPPQEAVAKKLVLKGLDSAEDARLAVEHGADRLVVSNHGGRAAETLGATVDCLPELVEAVGGPVPVFVDGGFRRGTDIYKALALGARAVGIGRP